MTAQERLRAPLEALSEDEAERTQIIVGRPVQDVVGLPDGWGKTLTGEPMSNVASPRRF